MRNLFAVSSAATIWAALLAQATAQDFPPNTVIASCADVKCPSAPNSVAAQCKVVDKTFTAIGQAKIPSDSGSPNRVLDRLSWVEGVAVVDRPGIDRTYDKSFYLGTPPDLELGGLNACAVFFTQVSDGVSFHQDDLARSQGTCQQALSTDCVAALVAQAKKVDAKSLSVGSACAALQTEFRSNLNPACTKFATGTRWNGIVSTRMFQHSNQVAHH
jgi:hypothetical protein